MEGGEEGGKDDMVEEGGDGRGEEGACEDELDTTEDVVSVKEVVSIMEEVSIVEGVSEVVSEDIVGGACTNDGDSDVQSGNKAKERAQGELDPIAAHAKKWT